MNSIETSKQIAFTAVCVVSVNWRKRKTKFAREQMIMKELYESRKNISAFFFWMLGPFRAIRLPHRIH